MTLKDNQKLIFDFPAEILGGCNGLSLTKKANNKGLDMIIASMKRSVWRSSDLWTIRLGIKYPIAFPKKLQYVANWIAIKLIQ